MSMLCLCIYHGLGKNAWFIEPSTFAGTLGTNSMLRAGEWLRASLMQMLYFFRKSQKDDKDGILS